MCHASLKLQYSHDWTVGSHSLDYISHFSPIIVSVPAREYNPRQHVVVVAE